MHSASARALFFTALLAFPLFGQQSQPSSIQVVVPRDPQAVAALRQSIAAMGGNVPSDSTAIGTVTITAGSATDQGTIRILTRGTAQTSVNIQTPASGWSEVFSGGSAANVNSSGTSALVPMETAASSQSSKFLKGFGWAAAAYSAYHALGEGAQVYRACIND